MIGNENMFDFVGDSHPTLMLSNATATNGVNAGPGRPYIAGRYMFVPCNLSARVEAYDLIDRDVPAYVGFVTVGAGPTWIKGRGKYIFVADGNGTIKSVDVSNPAAMTVVQTFAFTVGAGGAQRMDLRGRYLLIGGPESGGNANKLTLLDTANPASMSEAGFVTVGSTHRHIAALDSTHFALASRDTNTLYIIDTSNPAAPASVGSLLLSGTLTPLATDPNFTNDRPYVYAIGYGDGKFYVVDCVDPANPRKAGEATISLHAEDVVIVGRYALVSTRDSYAVNVVDIANPARPLLVQSFAIPGTPRMDRLAYSNGRIYVPDQTNSTINVIRMSGGKGF